MSIEGTEKAPIRALVLHPELKNDIARRAPGPALDEALALAAALPAIEVCGGEIVRLAKPTPGLLFGKGKIAELKARFESGEIELVLIDGAVTPVQQRNLEKAWGVKLLDRTGLILEIFSDRARTREGVLQVEMAALSFQRTRLVRAWTHLERQRGGFGFVGGPGETQIEADRRAIDEQILRLKRQLSKVVKTRQLQRAARARVPFPIVALVGYTNAGKSTLFNRLTGAEVLAQDMLFATLDPTMRRATLPGKVEVILSDTVGFISALPTELVAAFRATLEEVLEADVIVHVRDISHAETEAQAAEVAAILTALGVRPEVPQVEVWNKIDLLPSDELPAALARASRGAPYAISALTGQGVAPLLAQLAILVSPERESAVLDLPFTSGQARAFLHQEGVVRAETEGENSYRIEVEWTARQKARFAALQDGLAQG